MSFTKYLLPVLYNLGLYSAYLAGFLFLKTRSGEEAQDSKSNRLHFPWTIFCLFLAVAIPTTLQFFFPALLSLFQRDTACFLSGEWWRLVTPLFFQDGGLSGAVSNLIGLALIGFVAEQYWDSRSMLLVFFAGGIAGELVGLAWQPIGAGNSVGNFSLAASLSMICLMHRAPGSVRVFALLALGADILLVLLGDIHGPAALVGAGMALVLSRLSIRE